MTHTQEILLAAGLAIVITPVLWLLTVFVMLQ